MKQTPPAALHNYYGELPYDVERYWQQRPYELAAEMLAIRRLLDGKHFATGLAVDRGYGRLRTVMEEFCDSVHVARPTDKGTLPKTPTANLIVAVHRLERLADPAAELQTIANHLDPEGYAIIEVANYNHATNRLRHLVRARRLPMKPIDMTKRRSLGRMPGHHRPRAPWAGYDLTMPYYAHNPETVIKQLAHTGLRVERTLSVSNLRSPYIRRLVPRRLHIHVEHILQPLLATSYVGPSIFFLVKKG